MKTIIILSDSVNRRFLPSYGNEWVITPNLNRFSEKATVFNNHWCGSAPCMPARRDMFTGRYNFLERGWSGIEPYDYTLPQALSEQDVYTAMFTDHYHYLEMGGENYCQQFDAWSCLRGQEMDSVPGPISMPMREQIGVKNAKHESNRRLYSKEEDYPTPRTFKEAIDWLNMNRDEDNYFLWIEGFDPHEPFEVPDDYMRMYNDSYDGLHYDWPNYGPVNVSDKELDHVRKQYAATLTMMDKWFGKLLDTLDENESWEDTMIVFTTDHGFMLGEHGLLGKNYMEAYNEVFHLPLMIYHPEFSSIKRQVNALTQNIDLFPTVLEYHNIQSAKMDAVIGKSLIPLMSQEVDSIRDAAIYGYFGRNVNVTDGKYTYFRSAVRSDNSPLNLYGSAMTSLWQFFGHGTLKNFEDIEMGRHLSWTNYPVYKIPSQLINVKDPVQDFCVRNQYNSVNQLFNIAEDYEQLNPLDDHEQEARMIDLLAGEMKKAGAPKEQYIRLGMNDNV